MDHIATSRMSARTLIIGAGQAGLQLAASLRELGDTAPITVVGGESRPPYQRPPLSKAFLSGKAVEHELALRGADYYAANDITLICGEWVETITLDDDAAGSGQAVTRSGRTLAFDRLAFTVGGTPRRMRVNGAELAGIHYLRTLDDAVALKSSLDDACGGDGEWKGRYRSGGAGPPHGPRCRA
jgi:3-phenylpropionate/trans-cinnamate dioxygenase ferredoxin reductase subunit